MISIHVHSIHMFTRFPHLLDTRVTRSTLGSIHIRRCSAFDIYHLHRMDTPQNTGTPCLIVVLLLSASVQIDNIVIPNGSHESAFPAQPLHSPA